MRKLKITIAFLIVLMTIVIMSIIMLKVDGNLSKNNNGIREIPAEKKEPLEKETDLASFYLVDELIATFFSYITSNDEEDNDYTAAYNVLNEEFREDNDLVLENIEDYFKEYKGSSSYRTQEVYKEAITNSEWLHNEYLYIKGIIRKSAEINEVYIYMIKDLDNNTYNIEFISKEEYQENISNSQNNIEKIEILENEYNKLHTTTATERIACLKHMQDYKNELNNNEEEAYYLLDKEYRDKRFASLEEYKEYRKKMKEEIGEESFSKYLVNYYENCTEYVCKDKYGNMYIFTEEYPMQYRLKLDTYTIPTEKFKTEYNKSDDQNKMMLNIDKWIQMLNNRDYSAAYEVLDETFRNNNFGSEEIFEQYMREKFPLHYELEFGEYSNEADIGMQKIVLTDITGEDSTIIENTIIMQLKEEFDFVMSFEIQ